MSDQVVTIFFPHHGRTGRVSMPWVAGKNLQQYFHEHPLKQYSLNAKRKSHYLYNRKGIPVKLWYQPVEGDVIVFTKVVK